METSASVSSFGMYVVNGCLVVPVGADTDEYDIKCIGKEILQQVRTTGIKEILINVSAIKVMDSAMFETLRNSARASALLGATSVFVGFQPGVASALVDLDIQLDGLLTAVTMEDGFRLMEKTAARPAAPVQSDEIDDESLQLQLSGALTAALTETFEPEELPGE